MAGFRGIARDPPQDTGPGVLLRCNQFLKSKRRGSTSPGFKNGEQLSESGFPGFWDWQDLEVSLRLIQNAKVALSHRLPAPRISTTHGSLEKGSSTSSGLKNATQLSESGFPGF